MGAVTARVLTVLVLCWSTGCQETEGQPAQTLAPRSEAEMQHTVEIDGLLVDLQLDTLENDANLDRYLAAKDRLVEVMQESDISKFERLMLKGDYRDLSKDVRGKGGWAPRVYVSKKEKAALDAQYQLANALGDTLREYYIRTNSPAARDVFMRILKERDELHMDVGISFTERGEGGKDILRPGLKKTDLIETLHRQYRTWDRLEGSLEAARLLYIDGKYRDEAVWFFCNVLKDEKMECSQNAIEMAEYLGRAVWTRRECAVVAAFQHLGSCAYNEVDRATTMQYLLPWAKHIQKHGTDKTRWLGDTTLDRRMNTGVYAGVDKGSIPEGTPVPPNPATVIDLPQKDAPSSEGGDSAK